jgi:hypothetical protein
VTTEHFLVDNVTKRQVIENFGEKLSHLHVVLCLDLSFKSVHFIHPKYLVFIINMFEKIVLRVTFVIATRHPEIIGVKHLEAEQSENCLRTERSAINKVAIEQLNTLNLTLELRKSVTPGNNRACLNKTLHMDWTRLAFH